MAEQVRKKQCSLKVILTGDIDVGKTSLIQRYTRNTFDENNQKTALYAFTKIEWRNYNVAVWDTAGEERFLSETATHYRGAGAAIMVYDISSRASFDCLSRRLKLLPENCLRVVVGAKLDLVEGEADADQAQRKVRKAEAKQFAEIINGGTEAFEREPGRQTPFFETSSKTGEGVNKVFEHIFESCLLHGREAISDDDTIRLDEDASNNWWQRFINGIRRC